MLTYQLGQYLFHGMWGGPKFAEVKIQCETRPGVNGVSIHDLGKWGEPFQIQTIVFAANYAFAIEFAKQYALAAGDNAYVMIIGGVNVTGTRYKVLKVDPAPPKAVLVKAPAALSGYTGELRATWTLLPIADI